MNDSIVEEVHRSREQLWELCGRDWSRLAAYLREQELQHPERLVSREQFARRREEGATKIARNIK